MQMKIEYPFETQVDQERNNSYDSGVCISLIRQIKQNRQYPMVYKKDV